MLNNMCLFEPSIRRLLSELTAIGDFSVILLKRPRHDQNSLHPNVQICAGTLSKLHQLPLPTWTLPTPIQRRVCTVYAPTFHVGGDRSMGTSTSSFFTVNNKCHKEREEKTYEIKKGIIVQKDKNNKNKELTKRTLTLHLDPHPTPQINKIPTSDTCIQTTDRKWHSECAQKGAEGFGSPGQLSTRPKVLFFFKDYSTLTSSLWFLSVDRQPRRTSGAKDGQSCGWTSRSAKTAAELFSFGSPVSNFQSADNFIWHLGPHVVDILAGLCLVSDL